MSLLDEVRYAERPWTVGTVRSLLCGRVVDYGWLAPDAVERIEQARRDGWTRVELGELVAALTEVKQADTGVSAYEILCRHEAGGETDMGLLDVIQLERRIRRLEDPAVRAAAYLATVGVGAWEIGTMVRGHRTGEQLVETAIRQIAGLDER
jgi:hypothetical protein